MNYTKDVFFFFIVVVKVLKAIKVCEGGRRGWGDCPGNTKK